MRHGQTSQVIYAQDAKETKFSQKKLVQKIT